MMKSASRQKEVKEHYHDKSASRQKEVKEHYHDEISQSTERSQGTQS